MTAAVASDPFHLQRFIEAQAAVFEQVRAELMAGRKRSHWMWFIFPQLQGLGHSAMAQQYGIGSAEEAQVYLQHPLLGARLLECTRLVNAVHQRSAREIFGSPDDLKFRSCMNLFSRVPGAPTIFQSALERYFAGIADPRTLQLLQTR